MFDFARRRSSDTTSTLQRKEFDPPAGKKKSNATSAASVKIPVFAHDFSSVKSHGAAPPDATFVAVNTPEELSKLLAIANQQANEQLLASFRRSQGTLTNGDPLAVEQEEREAVKARLQKQFGDGWGLFFFWTRGGGQTGEGSPLWRILDAARPLNSRMGTMYPPPRYPTAPRIAPVKLPAVPLTESDR
jgi:hypothetical protein